MSIPDYMNQDDNAHLLRVLNRRIDDLNRRTRDVSPVGAIMDYGGAMRLNKWSEDRVSSVGANYSRWYPMNQIQESVYVDEIAGNAAHRLYPNVSGSSDPRLGMPGGLPTEGSYSVYSAAGARDLTSATAALVTGTRSWSLEAIFRPETLPQTTKTILWNGTGNGYGLAVGATGFGSGSNLMVVTGNGQAISTTFALTVGKWYHAIVVSENSDNTLKCYLGSFDPISRAFTFTSSSVAHGTAPTAPSGNFSIGGMAGWIDEALIYNGKIASGTARLGAEDRIRTTLEPKAPNGWLPCTGEAVARNRYGQLFNVIGTKHGAGDGSTTFALPNVPGAIIKS